MGACRAPACLWSPAVGSKDAGSGRVGGALCRGAAAVSLLLAADFRHISVWLQVFGLWQS